MLLLPLEIRPATRDSSATGHSTATQDSPATYAERSTQNAAGSSARSPQPATGHAPRSTHHSPEPGASAESALSVSVLTLAARDIVEGSVIPMWVRGEISDLKKHKNGHWYFCLRDDRSSIRSVIWSRDTGRVRVPLADGMMVVALGQLTVYPARGELQLGIRAIAADGEGQWRKAFDATLAALRSEGLLAPERKRPLARYPRRIAVVTSADGAALHDIVAVVRRRSPAVEIVLVPCAVQGANAPESICAALARVARWNDADCCIIGRGGGSREDLGAFNDERVARAVANCPMPVISAVGHEVDITLCDLVADVRAPTPSAAAEAAVPLASAMKEEVSLLASALSSAMTNHLTARRERLAWSARDASASSTRIVDRHRATLGRSAASLEALSPLATLSRGYAVARSLDGATLSNVSQFVKGEDFDLLLRDGSV
ncbi:MAG TPA: exodeoxyribonuclease VII large subunit, partial [Steroidobacteraceae bacterium]|nr:exodeoxyribonuclease VII large subunit [Steroidobacteraceae bacterium]